MTAMTTVLLQIPPKARAYVYGVFAVVTTAVGATQVGYAAAAAESPTWLTATTAVVAFVGGAIGATAATHTPNRGPFVRPT